MVINLNIYGIVYRIKNKINNKYYIGVTRKTNGFNGRYSRKGIGIERVYNYHNSHKENNFDYNKHLLSSIEKYGFEAFEVNECLDIAFSEEELNIKEMCYIKYYNSFENGYNNTKGGEGVLGLYRKSGSEAKDSIPIVQLDLNGNFIKEWGSISEAGRKYNNRTDISECCNKKQKSSKGFLWLYKSEYDEKIKYEYQDERGKYLSKEIVQLDLNGNYIKEWSTISEAARFYNTCVVRITDVCKNKRKTTSGYVWVYKCNYDPNKDYKVNRKTTGDKKRVVMLNMNKEYENTFDSLTDAAKHVNSSVSKICTCCSGGSKSVKKHIFMYENDYLYNIISSDTSNNIS